jgi:uncharacterized protein with LGFP repeats
MSDEPINDADLRKAIRQATRRLEQKSEAERRVLIQQVVEQAMNEELAEKRLESERVAEIVGEEIARDPAREAVLAREQAKSAALLLILLLLILWLIAAALGRLDIIRFNTTGPATAPTFAPRLGDQGPSVSSARTQPNSDIAAINSTLQPTPVISPLFQDYYNAHGGEPVFGKPISPELVVNGRRFQWFERGRLEEWPEFAGTPYAIQGGRLGAEFTKGITFPSQNFFVSQPNMRYFAETKHGVTDRFLQFWNQVDGMITLGFPISDQVQEMLPDKQVYTVQYFERGRIEYHPQQAGTPFEMQIGLVGRALFLNESKPNIIPPPQPTPVPLNQ